MSDWLHVERSDAAAPALESRAGPGVHRLATDGVGVGEIAAALRDLWLGDPVT